MSTITQQIRELQGMTASQLAERYEKLFGERPRVRNVAFLRRHVAWKLQEREFGGLSERAKARLDELIAQIDLPLGDIPPRCPRRSTRKESRGPLAGTTLIRRWHDQEIRVDVTDDGFEWDGTLYRSLSAVARAVTGANWNGKLFFGLAKRRPKP